jgi:hypothetical protein
MTVHANRGLSIRVRDLARKTAAGGHVLKCLLYNYINLVNNVCLCGAVVSVLLDVDVKLLVLFVVVVIHFYTITAQKAVTITVEKYLFGGQHNCSNISQLNRPKVVDVNWFLVSQYNRVY